MDGVMPIIEHYPANEYHAHPALSQSQLKDFAICPAKYRWAIKNPKEETEALRVGRAVHASVLENEFFSARYAVAPKCDRRTTAGKQEWAEFCASTVGMEILTTDEAEQCADIHCSVMAHPAAGKLLSCTGMIEPSMFWTDSETGVSLRGRPDLVRTDGIVVDLKTTSKGADAASFSKECLNLRYHVQAAMYLDGLKANGVDVETFVFIAVEKTAPYLVAVYVCESSLIEAGRAEYKRNLHDFAECTRLNQWPGYPETIQPLSLPVWATK